MRARIRFRLTHVICVLWVSKCPSSLSLSGWLEQIDTNSEIGTPSYNFNLVWFWSKGRTGCCQRQCFVFSPCAAGCVACGQNMSQTTTTRSKTEGELVFRSSERRWHKSIASCWLNWKSTRWYQPAQSSGNLTIRVCACICGTTFLPESEAGTRIRTNVESQQGQISEWNHMLWNGRTLRSVVWMRNLYLILRCFPGKNLEISNLRDCKPFNSIQLGKTLRH